MESNVEIVILGDGEVSLDIGTLTQYSGQGRCRVVECFDDTADTFREEVRSWAQRINWSVTVTEISLFIYNASRIKKGFHCPERKC